MARQNEDMKAIVQAIKFLNEKHGASRRKIADLLRDYYDMDDLDLSRQVNTILSRGVKRGLLIEDEGLYWVNPVEHRVMQAAGRTRSGKPRRTTRQRRKCPCSSRPRKRVRRVGTGQSRVFGYRQVSIKRKAGNVRSYRRPKKISRRRRSPRRDETGRRTPVSCQRRTSSSSLGSVSSAAKNESKKEKKHKTTSENNKSEKNKTEKSPDKNKEEIDNDPIANNNNTDNNNTMANNNTIDPFA